MSTHTYMSRCHEWIKGWTPERGSPAWVRYLSTPWNHARIHLEDAKCVWGGKGKVRIEVSEEEFADADEFKRCKYCQDVYLRVQAGLPKPKPEYKYVKRVHWGNSLNCHVMPGAMEDKRHQHRVLNDEAFEAHPRKCKVCKEDFEKAKP